MTFLPAFASLLTQRARCRENSGACRAKSEQETSEILCMYVPAMVVFPCP